MGAIAVRSSQIRGVPGSAAFAFCAAVPGTIAVETAALDAPVGAGATRATGTTTATLVSVFAAHSIPDKITH